MEKIEKIKKHFEEEAREFDEIILKLIPYYREMISPLLLSIPFSRDKSIKVIDLGCGTGTIAFEIRKLFPNAYITCLDISENMISMAKAKLGEEDKNIYIVANFYDFYFEDKYDVIISSLALHHLITDENKKNFYIKIYNTLKEGGVFYNADVVLGSNAYIQEVYMKKWKEFMRKNVSLSEIENKWIPKYKEEDSPTTLMNHLKWLEDIGFRDVDVIWKYYNYAVYGGYK